MRCHSYKTQDVLCITGQCCHSDLLCCYGDNGMLNSATVAMCCVATATWVYYAFCCHGDGLCCHDGRRMMLLL